MKTLKNKHKQNVVKCTFLITEENKRHLDNYCYSHGFDFPKICSYSDFINNLLRSFFSVEKSCKNFDDFDERCF